MKETNYTKRELDFHFQTILDMQSKILSKLDTIEIQTTKTNGRVNALESREGTSIKEFEKVKEQLTEIVTFKENIKGIIWVIGITSTFLITFIIYFLNLYITNLENKISGGILTTLSSKYDIIIK